MFYLHCSGTKGTQYKYNGCCDHWNTTDVMENKYTRFAMGNANTVTDVTNDADVMDVTNHAIVTDIANSIRFTENITIDY